MFDQRMGDVVSIPGRPAPTPEVEALVVRLARLARDAFGEAPEASVLDALASASDVGLLTIFAHVVSLRPVEAHPVMDAILRGQLAVAELIARSGGLWSADVAMEKLDVSRQTLANWRRSWRVLAIPRLETFEYPVAQFRPAGGRGMRPEPYTEMREILLIAGGQLAPIEVLSVLATPQDALATADGAPRTGFTALHEGHGQHVIAFVRMLVRRDDEDAPRIRHATARARGAKGRRSSR